MNAAAIDPATVKGTFSHGGKDYPLKHVYAWQRYAQTEQLWIYLTDAEVPAAAAQTLSGPATLAREGRFRGVRLVVHPTKPDLNRLEVDFYTPGEGTMGIAVTASGGAPWQRLLVGDKRVAGKLQYKGNAWSLDAEFSAPVLGSSGKMQTLTGAQAQKSPQAEVFLAYEKALNWQGIDAAGAYATPEKLAEMRVQIKQLGADSFKQTQAAMRKATPQGEARRKQIEKVVVDGDNAVLTLREGPNVKHVAPLAQTKDGWKIAP